MKTKINLRAAAVTALCLGALLGCANAALGELSGGEAAAAGEEGSFTITIPVGAGASAGRSAAGADYEWITRPGKLNYAQIIVLDADNRVVCAEQSRYGGVNPSPGIPLKGVTVDDPYTFLVLMGHWQRDYAAEGMDPGPGYHYVETAHPTLLAAGCVTGVPEAGEIAVTLFTIVVDTAFTAASGRVKEPAVTGKTPGTGTLLDTAEDWTVRWTIQNSGFKELFKAAAWEVGTAAFGQVFPEAGRKGFLRKATGVLSVASPTITTPIIPGIMTGETVSLEMDTRTSDSGEWPLSAYTCSAHFNLEYTAFNGREGVDWNAAADVVKPRTWIIRNGVNDLPQNAGTNFGPTPWTGTAADGPNGNGAVVFKVTTITYNPPGFGEDNGGEGSGEGGGEGGSGEGGGEGGSDEGSGGDGEISINTPFGED
jgi:uncharacterized membrane protein YgcG